MAPGNESPEPAQEKLKLLKSPLQRLESDSSADLKTGFQQNLNPSAIEHLGYRSGPQDEPTLTRYDDATNLEVFYDLFLACLSLFNQNQQISALSGLAAYTGFFCLIWTTWFVTGLYDVRFVTDSIFERCARGVHLGVLVGFVTVSPNFDPGDQDPRVFQTFSLILMVSRLCLAIEYGSIIFHLRQYPKTRLPLLFMVAMNFVAAMVYLGISFRFHKGGSRVFYAWYAMALAEIMLSLVLSTYHQVLSFKGTHMIRRMSLLTLIIFGEGVAIACGGITKVVKVGSHDDWTSGTIGVTTSCIGLIYIVFMVYFDWMHYVHLPTWRQITWSLVHFPLHLTLTMFVEGCAQFITFWKVSENTTRMANQFNVVLGGIGVEEIPDAMQNLIDEWLEKWPVVYTGSQTALASSMDEIRKVNFTTFEHMTEDDLGEDPDFNKFWSNVETVIYTLDNILNNAYGLDFQEDFIEDLNKQNSTTTTDFSQGEGALNLQSDLSDRAYYRFRVVFQYTFVTAGVFLALVTLLGIIARTKPWDRWAVIRTIINFLVAIGIGSVAAVSKDLGHLADYQNTPMILPTVLFAYLVVLVLNHYADSRPVFGFPAFSWRRSGKPASRAPSIIHQTEHMVTKYDPASYHATQQHEPMMYSGGGQQQQKHQEQRHEPQDYMPQPLQQARNSQHSGHCQQPQQQYDYYEYSGNMGPRRISG